MLTFIILVVMVMTVFALAEHTMHYYQNKQRRTLIEIWELIQSAAYAQNLHHKNQGKEFWQPLKAILDNSDRGLIWKPCSPRLINRMMGLSNVPPVHFMRQQFRIPQEEHLTTCRLCQIALNIGQWIATWDETVISTKEYTTHNLGSIHTYVNDDDLLILANTLTPETELFIRTYCDQTISGECPWETQ